MRLIAGLGNPGRDYARTRHNAGFMVVQRLLERHGGQWSVEGRFSARVARVQVGGSPVVLCQPQTFMNASGEAVAPLLKFYRIPLESLMVSVDDADLALGSIRLRPGGSSGGHHGLDSVERQLGTREYARQRVGIGRREGAGRNIAGYVLGTFSEDELACMEKVLDHCVGQLESWVTDGLQKSMNQFNGSVGLE